MRQAYPGLQRFLEGLVGGRVRRSGRQIAVAQRGLRLDRGDAALLDHQDDLTERAVLDDRSDRRIDLLEMIPRDPQLDDSTSFPSTRNERGRDHLATPSSV